MPRPEPPEPRFEPGDAVRVKAGQRERVVEVEWSPPQGCYFYVLEHDGVASHRNVREYELEAAPMATDPDWRGSTIAVGDFEIRLNAANEVAILTVVRDGEKDLMHGMSYADLADLVDVAQRGCDKIGD